MRKKLSYILIILRKKKSLRQIYMSKYGTTTNETLQWPHNSIPIQYTE
jgi:hypothetical protein